MSDILIKEPEQLDHQIRQFTGRLDSYPRPDRRGILRALHWSRKHHALQKRASGEPYIIHPMKTAEILIDLKMDPDTIKAALLHDVLEDTSVSKEEMAAAFGDQVAELVEGVTKIDVMDVGSRGSRKAESLRKMVWAMVKDIRVVFIKLADKRHNMSTLQYIPDEAKRERIARECLEIYSPMAGKLGMSSLKSDLEDLSFQYLHPDTFIQIRDFIAERIEERKQYLERIRGDILRATSRNRLRVGVETRAKHFYSVYRKMKDRGKDLDEIYDLLGVRILCESPEACYITLGQVHALWAPLEGRFKDYIARPKDNGYQSLHTTVLTEGGRPLEIQIRTKDMHETAEYGFAAHWAYKERKKTDETDPRSFTIVHKLKTLQEEGHDDDAGEFLEAIKRDVLRNSIIVYTPKGDPVELPEGSTAIDFAYHIHTEIGDHCMGAKANGSIIPLTRPLRSTETIGILTSNQAHPHVNWLKHVRSARARSKIRNWLNKHDADVLIDRNIVARKKTAAKADVPDNKTPEVRDKEIPDEIEPTKIETHVIDETKVGISIGNERNMMIRLGRCCEPAPGDRIIGYISRGRGIVVHKSDCKNLAGIQDFEERKVDVEWETASTKTTQRFSVHARYTSDLFSEIEGAIRKYRGHLISGSLDENERGDLEGFFTVEMETRDDFKKISKSIRAIPSVLTINKVRNLLNRPYT